MTGLRALSWSARVTRKDPNLRYTRQLAVHPKILSTMCGQIIDQAEFTSSQMNLSRNLGCNLFPRMHPKMEANLSILLAATIPWPVHNQL